MKPFLAASLALNFGLAAVVGHALLSRPAVEVSAASVPANSSERIVASPPAPNITTPAGAQASAADISAPGVDVSPVSQPPAVTLTSSLSGVGPESRDPICATSRAASPAPAISIPQEAIQTVNPSAPGNSLNFHGAHVAVAEAYSNGDAGDALAIDISPAAENESQSEAETSVVEASSPNASSNPRTSHTSREGSQTSAAGGQQETVVLASSSEDLNREDELFRMKWGWAAFDAARKEARMEELRQKLVQ